MSLEPQSTVVIDNQAGGVTLYGYTGAFLGKSLIVHQDSTVSCTPF